MLKKIADECWLDCEKMCRMIRTCCGAIMSIFIVC